MDPLDFPFEFTGDQDISSAIVTMTDKQTQLDGTIRDATNRPAVDFTIVVYPEDSRFWTPQSRRIKTARPGTDGHFVLQNLPPGGYLLAAVTDVEQGGWFDPEFLRGLVSASTRAPLAEGEKRTQDLQLAIR
jgi:uncharacterized protein (DUF2141 family)